MSKTLKLSDDEALALYPKAEPAFKALLEANWGKKFFCKGITDRIKTWEDVCEELDIDPVDSLPYKKAKTKTEKSINAFFKIQKISEVLNEDVEIDFDNKNQTKYYPYFEKQRLGWRACSCNCYSGYGYVGFGFYYTTSEKALYAGNQFIDIYSEYLPE